MASSSFPANERIRPRLGGRRRGVGSRRRSRGGARGGPRAQRGPSRSRLPRAFHAPRGAGRRDRGFSAMAILGALGVPPPKDVPRAVHHVAGEPVELERAREHLLRPRPVAGERVGARELSIKGHRLGIERERGLEACMPASSAGRPRMDPSQLRVASARPARAQEPAGARGPRGPASRRTRKSPRRARGAPRRDGAPAATARSAASRARRRPAPSPAKNERRDSASARPARMRDSGARARPPRRVGAGSRRLRPELAVLVAGAEVEIDGAVGRRRARAGPAPVEGERLGDGARGLVVDGEHLCSGRSKRLAQSWKPSATLTSRGADAHAPRARRTEPSTTTWTPSSRPISRGSRSAAGSGATTPREAHPEAAGHGEGVDEIVGELLGEVVVLGRPAVAEGEHGDGLVGCAREPGRGRAASRSSLRASARRLGIAAASAAEISARGGTAAAARRARESDHEIVAQRWPTRNDPPGARHAARMTTRASATVIAACARAGRAGGSTRRAAATAKGDVARPGALAR